MTGKLEVGGVQVDEKPRSSLVRMGPLHRSHQRNGDTAKWIEPGILTEKRNVRGHSGSVFLKRFAKTVS